MFVYRNFWIVNVSSSVSRVQTISHFWSLCENGVLFQWKKNEEKQTHCVQYMLHINRDYIKCPMEFIWQSLSHCSCFHIKHLEATWGSWQFYYYLGWSPSNLPMCLFIFMGETGEKKTNYVLATHKNGNITIGTKYPNSIEKLCIQSRYDEETNGTTQTMKTNDKIRKQ